MIIAGHPRKESQIWDVLTRMPQECLNKVNFKKLPTPQAEKEWRAADHLRGWFPESSSSDSAITSLSKLRSTSFYSGAESLRPSGIRQKPTR